MLAANAEQAGFLTLKGKHAALYNYKFAKLINWENYYLYCKGIFIFSYMDSRSLHLPSQPCMNSFH